MKNAQVRNQQRKSWAIKLKEILDQSKQLIKVKNNKNPTSTLSMTFLIPEGGSNIYVQFLYIPQTISNHTQGQVLGSMISDIVNAEYMVQ